MSETAISWLQHRADRARLMTQMLERLGCSHPGADQLALTRLMPEAIAHCLCCQDADTCSRWLEQQQQEATAYRQFCPNAANFEQLGGREQE